MNVDGKESTVVAKTELGSPTGVTVTGNVITVLVDFTNFGNTT